MMLPAKSHAIPLHQVNHELNKVKGERENAADYQGEDRELHHHSDRKEPPTQQGW